MLRKNSRPSRGSTRKHQPAIAASPTTICSASAPAPPPSVTLLATPASTSRASVSVNAVAPTAVATAPLLPSPRARTAG